MSVLMKGVRGDCVDGDSRAPANLAGFPMKVRSVRQAMARLTGTGIYRANRTSTFVAPVNS